MIAETVTKDYTKEDLIQLMRAQLEIAAGEDQMEYILSGVSLGLAELFYTLFEDHFDKLGLLDPK